MSDDEPKGFNPTRRALLKGGGAVMATGAAAPAAVAAALPLAVKLGAAVQPLQMNLLESINWLDMGASGLLAGAPAHIRGEEKETFLTLLKNSVLPDTFAQAERYGEHLRQAYYYATLMKDVVEIAEVLRTQVGTISVDEFIGTIDERVAQIKDGNLGADVIDFETGMLRKFADSTHARTARELLDMLYNRARETELNYLTMFKHMPREFLRRCLHKFDYGQIQRFAEFVGNPDLMAIHAESWNIGNEARGVLPSIDLRIFPKPTLKPAVERRLYEALLRGENSSLVGERLRYATEELLKEEGAGLDTRYFDMPEDEIIEMLDSKHARYWQQRNHQSEQQWFREKQQELPVRDQLWLNKGNCRVHKEANAVGLSRYVVEPLTNAHDMAERLRRKLAPLPVVTHRTKVSAPNREKEFQPDSVPVTRVTHDAKHRRIEIGTNDPRAIQLLDAAITAQQPQQSR